MVILSVLVDSRLLIVCPAYNEEGRISHVLNEIVSITSNVLVINDGSTDGTIDEIQSNRRFEQVEVISHPSNQGKGAAIRTGIKYFLNSRFEYVIFIDADGQHQPKHIYDFYSILNEGKGDFVLATRFQNNTWKKQMPFSRILSNFLSRFGLWILFNGFFIEDPQNGYRGLNKKAATYMTFETNGYEAETEMLILGYFNNLRFQFIPINSIYHVGKNTSKFSVFRDTWTIPRIMLKMFFDHQRNRKNRSPINSKEKYAKIQDKLINPNSS